LGSVWLPAPALVEAEDRYIYFAPVSLSLFFIFIFPKHFSDVREVMFLDRTWL